MAEDKDDLVVIENFETVILHRPAIGAAAEAEQEENDRLLLDVVVMEGAVVLQLLAGKDQTLMLFVHTYG